MSNWHLRNIIQNFLTYFFICFSIVNFNFLVLLLWWCYFYVPLNITADIIIPLDIMVIGSTLLLTITLIDHCLDVGLDLLIYVDWYLTSIKVILVGYRCLLPRMYFTFNLLGIICHYLLIVVRSYIDNQWFYSKDIAIIDGQNTQFQQKISVSIYRVIA